MQNADRRSAILGFLRVAAAGVTVAGTTAFARRLVAQPGSAAGSVPRRLAPGHPTPRPGITGAKVLTADTLGASSRLVPLFDGVREIPSVIDGIRCHCGCAELPGFYSLLSCFEGEAMARACPICQGEGRVAVRLHKEGKTLDEICAAIDAQFG